MSYIIQLYVPVMHIKFTYVFVLDRNYEKLIQYL